MPVSTRNHDKTGLSARLHAVLEGLRTDPALAVPERVQRAIELARILQQRATELQTPQERRQQEELARLMACPHDKATLVQITDQALRCGRAGRAADQLLHILDVQGVPHFFTLLDQALLKGFQTFGNYLPDVAMPLVYEGLRAKVREETANVILPAEEEHLLAHLQARHAAGLRMNLNLLGEALLGEEAVESRLESYLETLQLPQVECISVKISTIYSQTSPLAWEDTVEVLCDRMELLYREAARMRFTRPDGNEVPKFVYLDMEEYRDMRITAEVFMRTLERPGLERIGAGIALQAYLPDAWSVQKGITAWARSRVEAGGSPVTIRLVKGANMEMERVDAALHGWPQTPFRTKAETDANYKRMLHEGLLPENNAAVRLGIATHNLFDAAYALVLACEQGALDRIHLEMLEGMANHQRRALAEVSEELLLYAPATRREQFIHAVGYLIRRLDENTGQDNFLSHAFRLDVDSPAWNRLADQFAASFVLMDELADTARRTQDRRRPPRPQAAQDLSLAGFRNEPDTDFSLPHNVEWARRIIERWQPRHGDLAADIPLVVAGREIRQGRELKECRDPSRPGTVVGHYREAARRDLHEALACARSDPAGWRGLTPERRSEILGEVAQTLRERRGELLGAAMADGGKTFPESDPEVSEAIDFLELYRRSALFFHRLATLQARPKGVVAVIPPWNFPIAIPCGGIAAALAAGNCVILKPASDTVLVAWKLCKSFWDAGVPREALQFIPCAGGGVGSELAVDPGVDAVVLTGDTATALRMLNRRPDMTLMAETGGKDATIVTAMADRDQAINHVLHSAFSHSGQKCSATSLLILEEEVYNDPAFKATLCDAIKSLPVGSAWDRKTRVGPLIRPPGRDLERGLKELDPGERWAVMPKRRDHNPQLWSPGLKWDVRPSGFTHRTELFGPVLAVMKAKDLEEAIALVNQTGYGLTSGIESLDEREQQAWKEAIRAGNLYINRVTTGAVALRQPFGGMGKSAFGPGIKAGGPNYVAQLMDFEDREPMASDLAAVVADPLLQHLRVQLSRLGAEIPGVTEAETHHLIGAIGSYVRAANEEVCREHDHFRLLGQDNIRRYLPVRDLCIRVHPADGFFDVLARLAAARCVGCRIRISLPPAVSAAGLDWLFAASRDWAGTLEQVEEDEDALAAAIRAGRIERVRYASPERVPMKIFAAANQAGVFVARAPVLAEGRVELLWYVREQSISHDYHRYGNLGERSTEDRAPLL